MPDLQPPEVAETEKFKYVHCAIRDTSFLTNELRLRFPDAEKISPPLLQLSEVTFGYNPDNLILKSVNIDVQLDSRMAIVGANGAGKSTL